MASTAPRSIPRRETFCSSVRSSGPLSKSRVLVAVPCRKVIRKDRPCAALQKQLPLRTQVPPRRRSNAAGSVSTKSGTEDRGSATSSTRTWISALSIGFNMVMISFAKEGTSFPISSREMWFEWTQPSTVPRILEKCPRPSTPRGAAQASRQSSRHTPRRMDMNSVTRVISPARPPILTAAFSPRCACAYAPMISVARFRTSEAWVTACLISLSDARAFRTALM